ncbi:MAG TPA: AbfB domain-containing protein, partial [Actinoplanes sp.]|nr:AbfB domain-containing protein [Actinoplanes sp.]
MTARRAGALLATSTLITGCLVVATGSAAHAATLPTGTRSLESVNYPGRYVRHLDSLARIDPISTAQEKLDASFTVINGLASPSCYSFQAKNGRFLRHRDYRLRLDANTGDATFRADATFCAVDGSVSGSVSLVSFNYPDRRIRHRDYALWLDTVQDTAAFRADSSFTTTTAWAPKTTANPVLPGLFADPHLTYLNGRYYLYPTTDGYAG